MLIGLLGASLSWNMLVGKGMNRAGEGGVRAGYGPKGALIKNMDFNATSSFNYFWNTTELI